ncbi:ankyrin [Ascodesmis nigricans]|uniref:Ankyrin n=1 Tax=Ascodesmis nigricans TaxID=341454 RepID=A0A4S2MRU5_9PEZI|nr:ankyrin [Ascodesmis nigricans]
MAEAVGLTASIIQLFGVTVALSKYSYEYISGVCEAHKEVRELVDYITRLQHTLEPLVREMKANKTYGLSGKAPLDEKLILDCKAFLEEMEDFFVQNGPGVTTTDQTPKTLRARLRGTKSRLKWPFREKYTQEACKKIKRLISSLKLNLEIEQRLVERIEKSINWICKDDTGTRHEELVEDRLSNVGNWILETDEYLQWKDIEEAEPRRYRKRLAGGAPGETQKQRPKGRVLLGKGEAGVGKSYLCSHVVDDLTRLRREPDSQVGLAHIYFDHAMSKQQTKLFVTRNFVKQFLRQIPKTEFPNEVITEHEYHSHAIPTKDFLEQTLHSMPSRFKRLFIVCDALDEIESLAQRRQILAFLRELQNKGFSLFLTTRKHPAVDVIRKFENEKVITLSNNPDVEIRRFVEGYLERSEVFLDELQESSDFEGLYQRIVDTIVETACEMYDTLEACELDADQNSILVAKINVERICELITEEDIIAELDALARAAATVGHRPTTTTELDQLMDVTYDRILKPFHDYAKVNQVHAYSALSWVGYAVRPITVEELRAALEIELDDKTLHQAPRIDRLLDACRGFVSWDKEKTNQLRLVHFSARNYLDRHESIPLGFRGAYRGLVCATYISISGPQSDEDITPYQDARMKERERDEKYSFLEYFTKYPFFEYAIHSVALHLEILDEAERPLITLKLIDFFQDRKWATTYFWWNNSDGPSGHLPDFSALHVASAIGYPDGVQCLLSEQPKLIMQFLNHSYPAEKNRDFGLRPLELAAIFNRVPVARLLLDAGAECNKPGHYEQPPVLLATKRGHEDMIKTFLLHPRVSANVVDSRNHCLLTWTIFDRLDSMAEIILDMSLENEKIDLNIVDKDNMTPIFYTIITSNPHLLSRLLTHPKADVNIHPHPGILHTPFLYFLNSPFDANLKDQDMQMLKLFTTSPRVDLLRPDKNGATAPFYALWSCTIDNESEVFSHLLELGIYDLNHVTAHGDTLLARACSDARFLPAVKILLALPRERGLDVEKGMDVKEEDKERRGRSPLAIAAVKGLVKTVRVLLQDGRADVRRRDADGKTAVELARERELEEVVRVLEEGKRARREEEEPEEKEDEEQEEEVVVVEEKNRDGGKKREVVEVEERDELRIELRYMVRV